MFHVTIFDIETAACVAINLSRRSCYKFRVSANAIVIVCIVSGTHGRYLSNVQSYLAVYDVISQFTSRTIPAINSRAYERIAIPALHCNV